MGLGNTTGTRVWIRGPRPAAGDSRRYPDRAHRQDQRSKPLGGIQPDRSLSFVARVAPYLLPKECAMTTKQEVREWRRRRLPYSMPTLLLLLAAFIRIITQGF